MSRESKHSYDSLEEPLGRVAILRSLDEFPRDLEGEGLRAGLTALSEALSVGFFGWVVGGLIVIFLGEVVGSLCVLAGAILAFFIVHETPGRERVDARQLLETVLWSFVRFLGPDDVQEVRLVVWGEGFKVRVETSERLNVIVVWDPDLGLVMSCLEDGVLRDSTESALSEEELRGEHATDRVEAEAGRWISRSLSRTYRERVGNSTAPAPLSPVRLVPTDPMSVPSTPPEPLRFSSTQMSIKLPSRLVAVASYNLFLLSFAVPIGLLTLFLLYQGVASILAGGPHTMLLLTSGLACVACGSLLTERHRPARTRRWGGLPVESSMRFELSEEGVLTGSLVDEPEERVEIELREPFNVTWTRSAPGLEPVTVTLEVRAGRARVQIGARLSEDTPSEVLDGLEPWGDRAQIVDAEHVVALGRAIEYYGLLHNTPVNLRPTLPSADCA